MAVNFERVAYTQNKPAFWRGESQVLPGGFKLNATFPVKTVIPRGTLVKVNYPGLTADILKVAKVIAGGTTTIPRVEKGTLLQAGDSVYKDGDSTGKTISAIDRSNSDYDVITLNSALTGLVAGNILLAGDGTAPAFEPNAVVESDKVIGTNTDETISACDNVRVLEAMVPAVPSAVKTGLFLKGNPTVRFIYQ
jgi:hypothetical protein